MSIETQDDSQNPKKPETAAARFIRLVSVQFPPPRFESEKHELEWLAAVRAALNNYSKEIIDRACQEIMNTRGLRRDEKWFPLIAEIRKVCEAIKDDIERVPRLKAAHDEIFDGHKAPPYSKARTKLVVDLLRGSMGRQAAEEGWIGPLVDYTRANKCLPDASLIRVLKAQAQDTFELVEKCHLGKGGLANRLAILGDSILRRNKLWARVVLGQESEEALFRALPKDDEVKAA